MADYDLTDLPADEFVVHFGGRPNEVDAVTFANALLGFAEALKEVNRQISPELDLDVLVEGLGTGSFRAKLRAKAKSAGRLFVGGSISIALGVLSSYIYDKLKGDHQEIIVQGDLVIIKQGDDRIILPKSIWEQKERLPAPERIDRHVTKAFVAVEQDQSVTEFGLYREMDDDRPLTLIPRSLFVRLAQPVVEEEKGNRYIDEPASLTVVKAVFERGGRKWEFVWNGLKISARISDPTFFDRLAAREIWFAHGDQMDAVLRIHQRYDDLSRVYVNQWYEVVEVGGMSHKGPPQNLPLTG